MQIIYHLCRGIIYVKMNQVPLYAERGPFSLSTIARSINRSHL